VGPLESLALHEIVAESCHRRLFGATVHSDNISPETMHAFLALLREKYGGAEDYARNVAGLTEAEILAIKKNLN